jgi:hypothetical protein
MHPVLRCILKTGIAINTSLYPHLMDEDKQKPSDEKPNQTSGGPSPLAIWGSLIGLFVICKLVELEDKALATEIFKYGLILWLVGVVLSFIIGRSVRETKDNALGCGYIMLMGVI